MWTIPPLLGSLLIKATLTFLLICSSGSGLLILSPSYMLKQVKCRFSAVGFKVLCNVTPNPFPAFISHSTPGSMSLLHMCFCLLQFFCALSFLVFSLCCYICLNADTCLSRSVEIGSFNIPLINWNLYFSMKPCVQPNECSYVFL